MGFEAFVERHRVLPTAPRAAARGAAGPAPGALSGWRASPGATPTGLRPCRGPSRPGS